MPSSWAATAASLLLIAAFPAASKTTSDFGSSSTSHSPGRVLEKRSVLAFPPNSVLQINMGITLAGKLERNTAVVVLAFQQNANLPSDSQPFLAPSVVVTARKFSIYDHLRDVITSYGFNGWECLRKMVCQIGETPLPGGLLEDVITFVLSPSKQRSLLPGNVGGKRGKDLELLLESERLGKLGEKTKMAVPRQNVPVLDTPGPLTE